MTTTNTPARTYIVYSATNAVLAAIDPHTGEPLSSRRAHELATVYGAGAWICRAGVDVQVANPQPAADGYARSITYAPETNDFRMELDG